MFNRINKVCSFFLDLCPEASVVDIVQEVADASIVCERAMNKVMYTMRHVMSTNDENLVDCLTETFVKRSYEINYFAFAKEDRLCMELLQPISFADDSNGRAILLSYLQNSSLPFMKIFCAFMKKCFMSKFCSTNNLDSLCNCFIFSCRHILS